MNHVFVTTPAYGDARRLHWLLSERPKLRSKTFGLSNREQAEYLEASDRGLLDQPDPLAGRRALERARLKPDQSRRDMLQGAPVKILHARVKAGEGITRVIEDLASQSTNDPTGFACTVGEAIPAVARSRGRQDDSEFASKVADWLLAVPTTSTRALWRLWTSTKRDVA